MEISKVRKLIKLPRASRTKPEGRIDARLGLAINKALLDGNIAAFRKGLEEYLETNPDLISAAQDQLTILFRRLHARIRTGEPPASAAP